MATVFNATPLIALDAIVVDTETTGLDPRKARIVEMAAVRITGGRIDTQQPLRRLVSPGEPVPPEASRIHGIDDVALEGAPDFRQVWPEFSERLTESILIGHTIGFDLAILLSECRRAGLAWAPPRTLDTRLLAELVEPSLAGFALEQLAAWLAVPVEGRHSAMADAVTTARIFLALLPRLRERGIRTLAEAEHACRGLTAALDTQHRAGWAEPVSIPEPQAFARIETYPYRHRVRDVMTSPAAFIDAQIPLADALTRMAAEQVSSLFVRFAGSSSNTSTVTGIVTERDVMRALAERGSAALAQPVEAIASRPLEAVPADTFVYRAVGRMSRLRVRHLGVTDQSASIIGALSARDLLRVRAAAAVSLGDEIDVADDVAQLGHAWAKLPHVAAALLGEGLAGREIAAVISDELGALTARAAVIAERRMAERGHGAPPSAYAFAVLGSAGRGESLLAMDQDNALIFSQGDPGGAEDRWFETMSGHIADILHEVGVPYCAGGVMAKNPLWRGSLATWRVRVAHWISRSDPQDLLSVDIFFDLRGVHGAVGLADTLWREAFAAAHSEAAFAKLLAEAAGSVAPAVGLFGNLKTEHGRVDLKKAGLFGIVTAARVLAIRHHVLERATPARLRGVRALGLGGKTDLDTFEEAHALFVELILRQQIADIDQGLPPTNTVEIKKLSRRDRDRLRASLRSIQPLETLVHDLLFRG